MSDMTTPAEVRSILEEAGYEPRAVDRVWTDTRWTLLGGRTMEELWPEYRESVIEAAEAFRDGDYL